MKLPNVFFHRGRFRYNCNKGKLYTIVTGNFQGIYTSTLHSSSSSRSSSYSQVLTSVSVVKRTACLPTTPQALVQIQVGVNGGQPAALPDWISSLDWFINGYLRKPGELWWPGCRRWVFRVERDVCPPYAERRRRQGEAPWQCVA